MSDLLESASQLLQRASGGQGNGCCRVNHDSTSLLPAGSQPSTLSLQSDWPVVNRILITVNRGGTAFTPLRLCHMTADDGCATIATPLDGPVPGACMQRTNPFYHRGPIHDARFFRTAAGRSPRRQLLSLGRAFAIDGMLARRQSSLLLRQNGWPAAMTAIATSTSTVRRGRVAAPGLHMPLLVEALARRQGRSLAFSADSSHVLPYRRFLARCEQPSPWAAADLPARRVREPERPIRISTPAFSGLRWRRREVAFVTASSALGWLLCPSQAHSPRPSSNIFTQIRLKPFSDDGCRPGADLGWRATPWRTTP